MTGRLGKMVFFLSSAVTKELFSEQPHRGWHCCRNGLLAMDVLQGVASMPWCTSRSTPRTCSSSNSTVVRFKTQVGHCEALDSCHLSEVTQSLRCAKSQSRLVASQNLGKNHGKIFSQLGHEVSQQKQQGRLDFGIGHLRKREDKRCPKPQAPAAPSGSQWPRHNSSGNPTNVH